VSDRRFNVVSICSSLRKGSYNRLIMNALPGFAPLGMRIMEAPSYRDFPLYDSDVQDAVFPAGLRTVSQPKRNERRAAVEAELELAYEAGVLSGH
jgi:chromate reductase, NAD(P)H dehydrogenase (quinone)